MTDEGKCALATALSEHDPAYLADLAMIAKKLGPFAGVGYLSDSPETQAWVVEDVAEARLAYIKELRAQK